MAVWSGRVLNIVIISVREQSAFPVLPTARARSAEIMGVVGVVDTATILHRTSVRTPILY